MLAAVMPLPSELVTPPVTKTYLGIGEVLRVRLGVAEARHASRDAFLSAREQIIAHRRVGSA